MISKFLLTDWIIKISLDSCHIIHQILMNQYCQYLQVRLHKFLSSIVHLIILVRKRKSKSNQTTKKKTPIDFYIKKKVPAINELGIDVACVGNHDFDFGLPTLKSLISATKFPWLLSNVVDSETGEPITGDKWVILKRNGLKIGIIGLVEK